MSDELKREVEDIKKQSTLVIRLVYWSYKTLRFLQGDLFCFVFTSIFVFHPVFFSEHPLISFFVSFSLHYFILWKIIKPKIDQIFKLKKQSEEMDYIIHHLSQYFNNRKKN
jgi:hypothetical protein